MKRILIAFDDSPGADAAMRDMVRAGFPDQCEARVQTIADVWLPPEDSDPATPSPAGPMVTRAEARQHATELLREARAVSTRGAERLRALFPNWTIHHGASADSPSWGILAEAQKWKTDLIVIGSHGRSRLEKFFLGSVSYKVAAEARCSVRVFKEQRRDSDPSVRVMIATDGSADAEKATEEALNRRWPVDTRFQLVTVMDTKLRGSHVTYPDLLESRAELFRKRGFDVSTHVLEGDPKSELLAHATSWEADCIFLGARGLQHGDRLYLGTLASAVLTRAHCTVEIVRPASIQST
jgi:nucleotide-binding universal stress UspA family protein